MLIEDHLLKSAKQIQSPNYSERLNEDDINLIVIHSISLPPGKYNNSYIEEFFCNKLSVNENKYFESISDLKVSSHILIKRARLFNLFRLIKKHGMQENLYLRVG